MRLPNRWGPAEAMIDAKITYSLPLLASEGMVGYPESLTDPSYAGQILVLTFPIVGNYGVPSRTEVEAHLNNLPKYFESSKIHVAGLVVAQYVEDYSHYLATSSLAEWLKEQGIPAIYGVDTRAIVQKIRDSGVLLGKLLLPGTGAKVSNGTLGSPTNGDASPLEQFGDVEWHDPNTRNLVAEVSLKQPVLYSPVPEKAIKVNGKTIRIMCVDVGMKNNQIRCFVNRGAEVKVVPWDYDFLAVSLRSISLINCLLIFLMQLCAIAFRTRITTPCSFRTARVTRRWSSRRSPGSANSWNGATNRFSEFVSVTSCSPSLREPRRRR